jgi:hypothetical protein
MNPHTLMKQHAERSHPPTYAEYQPSLIIVHPAASTDIWCKLMEIHDPLQPRRLGRIIEAAASVLFLSAFAWAFSGLAGASELMPDGAGETVRIGNLVLDDVNLSDPAERAKVENMAKRIEEMRKNTPPPARDLTGTPTGELFSQAVLCTEGRPPPQDVIAELSRRKDELKRLIESSLDKPGLAADRVLELSRMPYWAGIVGSEYQAEVAGRLLFHPDMPRVVADVHLLDKGGLLSLVAESRHDQTAILDRLIAEGRIEKGSEVERRWRKRLEGARHNGGGRQVPQKGNMDRNDALERSKSPEGAGVPSWIYVLSVAILAFGVWIWVRNRN